MGKGRRFILIGAVVVVVLAGMIVGGVALANGGEGDGQCQTQRETMLDRALEIYEEKTGTTVDREALEEAFIQAREEVMGDALQNRLQSMVGEGRITQSEADQHLEWWQSRPDVPLGGGMRGAFHGRGSMPRFGGVCAPME